jgi:hypothetical protein
MKKTLKINGEKVKVEYSNEFNYSEAYNSTNIVTINNVEYPVNCLPNYKGWEYKGKTYSSEKQLAECICNE